LVLSVTIHATFVGAYDKRKYEFSLYKALGYSNQQCLRKIAKEILYINLCRLILGSIILLLTVYFLNEFFLNTKGIPLLHFKLDALLATLLCDGIIIFPILLTRLRQLKKYNITEY
jgi:ABC-type antimicrobial peptide transport system permease subunit